MNKPQVATALVSIAAGSWFAFERSFSLPDLENLSRLVEAYVLHDKLITFHDSSFSFSILKALDSDPDPEGVSTSIRYERLQPEAISPLLRKFITSDVVDEMTDLKRALIYLRNPGPFGRRLKPTKRRTIKEWASLPDKISGEFSKAESVLSQKLNAVYYPSAEDAKFIGARLVQFGQSAAMLLEQFTKARSRQIAMVQKLVKPHDVEFSPPLIVAYAAACAQTFEGFRHVIRDLRNDSQILRLRKLVAKIGESEPADQIDICNTIDSELRRILELPNNSFLDAAEALQSIPTSFASGWLETVQGVSNLAKLDQLISKLRVRSQLNVLRKLHKRIPSPKQFHTDLVRIFGRLEFNEQQLKFWLSNPTHTNILRSRAEELNLIKHSRNALGELVRQMERE
jgi:hypothetical protein